MNQPADQFAQLGRFGFFKPLWQAGQAVDDFFDFRVRRPFLSPLNTRLDACLGFGQTIPSFPHFLNLGRQNVRQVVRGRQ